MWQSKDNFSGGLKLSASHFASIYRITALRI